MRRVPLFLAIIMFAGCGAITAVKPDAMAGTYVLQTFSGLTLPTVHQDGFTITAGSMVLNSDATFVFGETTANGRPDQRNGHGTDVILGSYTVSGTSFALRVDATTPGTGTVFNGVLTLTSQDGVRTFSLTK